MEPVAFATICSGGYVYCEVLTALRRVFKRTFLSQAFKTTLRLDSPHESRFVAARTINP
jgi:hypothetical protein